MIVYIDDMLLLARGRDTSQLWRCLEKRVDFKEKVADIERYLGARYLLDPTTNANTTLQRLLTDMDNYAVNATAKFAKEYGQPLSKVSAPHLGLTRWRRRVIRRDDSLKHVLLMLLLSYSLLASHDLTSALPFRDFVAW